MDLVSWIKRQIKELPDNLSAYSIPFMREELTPAVIAYRDENIEKLRAMSKKERKKFLNSFARKYLLFEFPKYNLMRTKNRLLNKSSWFDQLKMSGAVTTTSAGTSNLFNNQSVMGRSICGKEKCKKCNKKTT